MPIEDTVYYDSDGKKFQLYINGSYQTIGAVHLDAINTENNNGIYTINFDSAYDITLDPYQPMLSLTPQDSDANPITWSVTKVFDLTPTSINPNSLGSVERSISKVSGVGTSWTISPTATFSDSHTIALEREATDVFKVTGKISTAHNKSGLPKSGNLDSIEFWDNEFRFFIDYNLEMAHISDINAPEYLKYVGLGSPDVKYKATSFQTTKRTLGTDCQGIVFNDVDSSLSGKKLFAVNNSSSGRTIDQYNIADSYDISLILSATTADRSLNIYNNLGVSNSITEAVNSSNLTGLDFNDSGNRLFLADAGHNNIYQYNLVNPYDLDSFALYETDYFEHVNVNTPVNPSQSAGHNIRNYQWYWYYWQSIPIWSPPANIYDITSTTHLSGDGKHYYMMDADGIRQFDLLAADNLNTASYKGQFNIREFSHTVSYSNPNGRFEYVRYGQPIITFTNTTSRITQYFSERTTKTGTRWRFNFGQFPSYRNAGHFSTTPLGFSVSGVFYITGYRFLSEFVHSAYPQCFTLSDDGTKMYIVWGCCYNRGILNQYTLSTPYDITTATSIYRASHGIGSKSPDVDNVTESKLYGAWGIEIKPDGTSMFVWDNDTNYVYEFTMTTPYDISTIPTDANVIQPWSEVYTRKSPQAVMSPRAKHFKMNRSGTKYYLSNAVATRQYSMSTAYDISTAVFEVERSALGSTNVSNNSGFELNSVETAIYLADPTNDRISSFQLTASSSANNDSADLGSAVEIHHQKFLNLDSHFTANTVSDVLLTSDGKKMYVSEKSTNKVHRYNLADSNEVYSAVYDSAFSTGYSGLTGMVLNDSENKMIVSLGTSSRGYLREYTIANPLSSSTFNTNEYLLTGNYNGNITDVHFKNDGSEFITIGDGGGLDIYSTRNNFVIKPI